MVGAVSDGPERGRMARPQAELGTIRHTERTGVSTSHPKKSSNVHLN